MLNQLLNQGFYGLLGLTLTILVSGDIAEQKYLQGTAKAVLVSSVALTIKQDKEEISRLTQDILEAKESQAYFAEKLNQVSTKYVETIEKLELSYHNQIKDLEAQLSSVLAYNKNLKLDIEALSLLCSREFIQLKQEVEELKIDCIEQDRQTQQKTQSNQDRLRNLKVNYQQKIEQLENCTQSIQDKLDSRLVQIETKLKPIQARNNNVIVKKNASATKIEPLKLAKSAPVSLRNRQSKTVVLIDEANYYNGCKDLGIKPDYKELKHQLMPETGDFEFRIYIGVFEPPSPKQIRIIRKLNSLGYKVVQLPINTNQYSGYQVKGDDVSLSCDLVEKVCLQEITPEDKVIIVTGDGDYFPALEKAQERNIDITLISSNPSRHLHGYVNRYLDLHFIEYNTYEHKKLDDVA